MNGHDEQFLPEQVDEQIERIEQSTQQEPASRLIHDLHIVSQDSTEMFDRVWERLLDHMEHMQIPPIEAQQRLNERIDIMSPIQPVQQPKPRRRFTSWLTLVAAIIIAILVAGSAVAVFHYAHTPQSHSTIVGASTKSHPTSTAGITPTATATPLPTALCTVGGDSGWQTVCTSNQQTTIDLRGNLQGTGIHIYAGYADSNRIILVYTLQLKKSNPNQMMPPPTLTLSAQKGVSISPRSTGGGFTDPKTMQDYELESAPLLSVANTITTLHLHVDVAFFSNAGGKASFDFSLPFHRGHTVTINQTQMVNGQPITLDHASISATQTIIYVRGTQLNTGMLAIGNPLTTPTYDLHIGNWSNKSTILSSTWNVNDDKHQPIEGIELVVNYPLLNHTGDWTLLIHHEAIPGATSDVVFHFKN
jgi:hypothetical protein